MEGISSNNTSNPNIPTFHAECKNTAYNPRNGTFFTVFGFPRPPSDSGDLSSSGHGRRDRSHSQTPAVTNLPIIKGNSRVCQLLRQWYREGTAAGHYGDFYDNHDNDHSNFNYGAFPQLTCIEFDAVAKRFRLHSGLQARFLRALFTYSTIRTIIRFQLKITPRGSVSWQD